MSHLQDAALAPVPCPACLATADDCQLCHGTGRVHPATALGFKALEILALDELPADFDAPDKIGAVRNAARALGLLGKAGP